MKPSKILLFLCSLWLQQQHEHQSHRNGGGFALAQEVTESPTSSASAATNNNEDTTDDSSSEMVRYVATYTSNIPGAETFLNILNQTAATLDFIFDAIENFDIPGIDINFSVIRMPPGLARWLRDNLDDIPGIDFFTIEPDTIHYSIPTNRSAMNAASSLFSSSSNSEVMPYGVEMVGALNVDDSQVSNRKICIIDSGYDRTHPDLPNDDVTGTDDSTVGDWFVDGTAHGTHVAGTIAALGNNNQGVTGVINRNPNNSRVGIHIVKVFDSEGGFTYGSSLVKSLQACQDAGANVVSMSLGGTAYSSFEESAFQSFYETGGMLLVAAAGNSGQSWYSYPASYDSVISVAAVDRYKSVAFFSQFNDQVELAAPGVDVLSTIPGGGYEYLDGTSMACPHVSAVAALVWSYDTTKTAQEIRYILQATAEDLGWIDGRDVDYGFGLVRADLAVEAIQGNLAIIPTPAPNTPDPNPPTNAECVDSPADWVDSGGDGCEWYSARWLCFTFAQLYANNELSANDVCCSCGGGVSANSGCVDDDWEDSFGDGCDWYKEEDRCSQYGNSFENNGQTASTACCACQGVIVTTVRLENKGNETLRSDARDTIFCDKFDDGTFVTSASLPDCSKTSTESTPSPSDDNEDNTSAAKTITITFVAIISLFSLSMF